MIHTIRKQKESDAGIYEHRSCNDILKVLTNKSCPRRTLRVTSVAAYLDVKCYTKDE